MPTNQLDIHQLRQILPQDYPFLMLDRVVDYKENESLVAVKNITANEWCMGEVGQSVFPETLILEVAAQAAIVLYHVSRNQGGGLNPQYILGKTEAEFFDTVRTGDQLNIISQATKMLKTHGYMDTDIAVGNNNVAKVKIMYSVQREKQTVETYA